MKGKRKCKERILAFVLAFAMVIGMVVEPVQLQAAAADDARSLQGTEVQDLGDDENDLPEGGETGEPEEEETYTVTVEPEGEGPYYQGTTVQFSAKVTGSESGEEIESPEITWSCEPDENGTSVDGNGLLTIGENASGKITVTAAYEGVTDFSTITVTDALKYSVTGTVTVNGKPVPGVAITCKETEETDQTDDSGKFTFNLRGNKTYTLSASKDGFESAETTVNLDAENVTADIELTQSSFSVTGENNVAVGGSISFSHDAGFPEGDINSVTRKSSDDSVLAMNEGSGVGTAQKAGSAEVYAIVHTSYGDFQSESYGVTVEQADTEITLSVVKKDRKTVELTATVKDEHGRLVEEGEVEFKIERPWRKTKTYTEEIVDGKAVINYKSLLSLDEKYTFTAVYKGVEGKYNESEPDTQTFEYSNPIKFKDSQGEYIENNSQNPFKVVYGDTVKISLEQEDEGTYSVENKAEGVLDVTQGEEDNEYTIKGLQAAEGTYTVTFSKKAGEGDDEEVLSTDFYVQVEKRTLHINGDASEMTYSKVYDRDETVDTEQDTITFKKLSIQRETEEGKGIVGKDDVKISLNVPEGFQGELVDKSPINVTTEGQGKIRFNENDFSLEGTAAGNYQLGTEEVEVNALVTITARPLKLTVGNATREFGHGIGNTMENEVSYTFIGEPWLTVEKVEENSKENEGLLKEDSFEIPAWKEFLKDNTSADAKPCSYSGSLNVDQDKLKEEYERLQNYNITVNEGTLTIVSEIISDCQAYLNLKNQENVTTTYIAEDKTVWVRENGGVLKLYANDKKGYDEVILLEINEKAVDQNGVSLTNDGYKFQREDYKGTVELKLKLRKNYEDSGETADSEPFKYEIQLDGDVPTVEFSNIQGGSTVVGKLIHNITFGVFGKDKYDVTIKVTDPEADNCCSGLKNWQYAVLPVKEDIDSKDDIDKAVEELVNEKKAAGELSWSEAVTEPEGTITICRTEPGQEDFVANNYIVLVKPYDNVNNSETYTSMGVVLDNNDPIVELDLAKDQENRRVYDGDVKLTASVYDENELTGEQISGVSGIRKVYYQIAIGKDNLDKAEIKRLFTQDEDKMYTLKELRKELKEELREELSNLDITVDSEIYNSNDVWVRVTAEDNSGNKFSAYKDLKIDTVDPTVNVRYETEASEDYAPYYNQTRTAIVTIKERNLHTEDVNELYFDVKREKDTESIRYSLSGLDALDGVTAEVVSDSESGREESQYTDDRTVELKVSFEGDDKYNFDVHCVDTAGRENKEENQSYFVIDKTAPRIQVSYYTEDGEIGVPLQEDGRIYADKGISAKVEVKEHNFALEGQEVNVSVNVDANRVQEGQSIPDYYAQERVNDGQTWFAQNVDSYASVYSFNIDANYTHSVTYTDLAGNSVTYGPGCFTVDATQPAGTVSIKGFGFWERFLETITFGLFSPSTVDVEVTGEDHTSPIYAVQYQRFHDQMTREDLEAYDWNQAEAASWENPGYAAFSVDPDEQFIVYTKVTDYAGNYQYFSSDGMIVDSSKPAPVITVTNLSQSQNGIFNEDVSLQIDVEDPTVGDTYAGLERVWYTVSASGNVTASETIELLNNTGNRVQGNKTFSQVITVPASVYNSNEVKVQAFAVDFSGNQGESETTELKIDVTNPTISVAWDLNNPMNGKYYKDTRTATVTVTDRNFDPNNVRFSITNTDGTEASIGEWSSSGNIGVSDEATSTCQVSFPADGDYTFTLGCTDLAGNSGEYGQTDEFTIDKTVPELSVSYDNNSARNGNYYKEGRTATVTIREHNFNEADVKAAITASLEGSGISAPSISGFSGSGDVHTATVRYAADGDYTFDVDYTDMAGNQAVEYTPDEFTVDLTAPEIEILDIEDKSANNAAVSPSVKATDVNYDAKNVTVTITGANNGKVNIDKVVSAVENGQTMKFNDFAREEKMDDLYTLTAKAVDMAGNEKEESIRFSVNRYGSVYVLDDDTKEWLSTKDYTYINQEKEVGILEYNVDSIKESKITVNRDGELQTLKEQKDYTVSGSGSDAQWKEIHYTLNAENFETEGNYTVILNTQDEASNAMNNTSVKKSNKNLPVEFAVDKTAPTVVISGVEDGGSYQSADRTMTVDAKDNLALSQVTVAVDGKATTYQGKDLTENDGVIDVVIDSANDYQEIQVTASDEAGNVLGQKQVNGKGQPVTLSVLVTPNVMIQYYMNKPLFFGSIAAVMIIAGALIFVIWKKRQRENK